VKEEAGKNSKIICFIATQTFALNIHEQITESRAKKARSTFGREKVRK